MLEAQYQIDYNKSKLTYYKYGDGSKNILLFHGFGQDHSAFHSWTEILKKDYTVYSFDLFFHGSSNWKDQNPLEKEDWRKILELFFEKEKVLEFELVGFSLGGKFALAALEIFPWRIKKITLLAPDGIKTGLWYSLATYPIALRILFKSIVLKPGRLWCLIKFLRFFHIVDRGLLRFAESQMDTGEKRRRVYNSWVYFRHLKFDLKKLTDRINSSNIPLIVIIGKYDKVIPPKNLNRFVAKINSQSLQIIDAGHNDLISKSILHLNLK